MRPEDKTQLMSAPPASSETARSVPFSGTVTGSSDAGPNLLGV